MPGRKNRGPFRRPPEYRQDKCETTVSICGSTPRRGSQAKVGFSTTIWRRTTTTRPSDQLELVHRLARRTAASRRYRVASGANSGQATRYFAATVTIGPARFRRAARSPRHCCQPSQTARSCPACESEKFGLPSLFTVEILTAVLGCRPPQISYRITRDAMTRPL